MFTSDGDSSVVFKVSPTSGNVSLLVATGPASWTDQDAMAFCKQFLPDGATKTDAATSHQTFHADLGDLRLDVAAAACKNQRTWVYSPAQYYRQYSLNLYPHGDA